MKSNKLFVLVMLIMLPVSAFSHAPKKITLSYDKESGSLIVSVIHPVKDVKDHYIESIAVKVNGEIVKTEEYTSQTSKESEDVTIALPDLKTGDEIEIRAKCNKMGAKTGEITLE